MILAIISVFTVAIAYSQISIPKLAETTPSGKNEASNIELANISADDKKSTVTGINYAMILVPVEVDKEQILTPLNRTKDHNVQLKSQSYTLKQGHKVAALEERYYKVGTNLLYKKDAY